MFGIFAFAASTAVPAGVTTYALTKVSSQEMTVDRGRSLKSLFCPRLNGYLFVAIPTPQGNIESQLCRYKI